MKKENLLDNYIGVSAVSPYREYRQAEAVNAIFKDMALSLAEKVTEHRDDLGKAECVFILTCKIYTLSEYIEAHQKLFKGVRIQRR